VTNPSYIAQLLCCTIKGFHSCTVA